MENLTEKQRKIFDYLRNYKSEYGFPPTLREIGEEFGLKSTNGVNDHLLALEKKGYIKRSPDKSRAIEIFGEDEFNETFDSSPAGSIPILGAIAAGQPLLAAENIEGYLKIDKTIINADEAFALSVKGESMIEDHILDGDYVIIRRQTGAAPREIVAVLINDEVTLKRFYHHGDYIELRPSNPAMSPIKINRGDASVRILGKMIGLIRRV
ncbi:MAG: transcriptional repressor LexA [Candidatus Margulisbacteria bacterium]|nr:transcriptional repressor LexA [Candidatus Margulisiibacteriota bacterium]